MAAPVMPVTSTGRERGYSGDMRPGALARRDLLRGILALAGLGLFAGCGMLPPTVERARRAPRLGYLHPGGSTVPGLRAFQGAFLDGMRDLGYTEGGNLTIEWRWAEGDETRLPALAQELVGIPVDVIVAVGSALQAAKAATASIPIVFPAHSDPVGSGFVATLARPGGNITGLSSFSSQMGGKRLELLKETVPGLSRLAVLWLASQPTASGAELRVLEQAAGTLTVGLVSLSVGAAHELPPTFAAMTGAGCEGLVTLASPLLTEWRTQIVALAARHRLPALYSNREYPDNGGLMSYGANGPNLYRRAATYVDRIFKGAAAADLPVEQPTEFDLVINLAAARELGLTIPPSVLQQATEVIR